MSAETVTRLPGIAFRAEPPPLPEALPRMDVAAWVGFASSGPLHLPVPIEDPARFAEIFGADPRLGWDTVRGCWATAHLGAAVRAFFRNGGRRCHVIRVALADPPDSNPSEPGAASNRCMAPGVWRWSSGAWNPATFVARAPGSWADPIELGAGIERAPLGVRRLEWCEGSVARLWLASVSEAAIREGDLVRIRYTSLVDSVEPVEAWGIARTPAQHADPLEPGLARPTLDVEVRHRVEPVDPWGTGWMATRWSGEPAQPFSFAVTGAGPGSDDDPADGTNVFADLSLETDALVAADIVAGEPWRIDTADGTVLFSVATVDEFEGLSPLQRRVRVTGPAVRVLAVADEPWPDAPVIAEVLTLELTTGSGGQVDHRLGRLGCERRHPRFCGALPTDIELFFNDPHMPDHALALPADDVSDDWRRRHRSDPGRSAAIRYQDLWREVDSPRFPLAGDSAEDAIDVPFGLVSAFLPVLLARHDDREAFARDGLAAFSLDLFTDEALADVGAHALMIEADAIRYQRPMPRPLRGIHAVLSVEEATLIGVPDAVHPGWDIEDAPVVPDRRAGDRIAHPEWASCCDPHAPDALGEHPPHGRFLACAAHEIARPEWTRFDRDAAGVLILEWSQLPGAIYELESAGSSAFTSARVVHRGPANELVLHAAAAGAWYRVRAIVAGVSSHWSDHRTAQAEATLRTRMRDDQADTQAVDDALVRFHTRLLTLGAGRGDLFAVLALPRGRREREAIAHALALGVIPSSNLGAGEFSSPDVLSHGALFHPWVVVGAADAGGAAIPRPPDGTAGGLIAARSRSRGAWVAPANEPLRGIVALDVPPAASREVALFESQINVVRREPRGFLTLSDWTLSADPDLRPIGVRRLLHLLRRLALRIGQRFVFEPNNEALRRAVKRALEEGLEILYQGGAFAGDSRQTSFQVVVDDSVNPATSVEVGRFIAEVRVAPSLPMRFLTVRLVQTGTDGFAVSEG